MLHEQRLTISVIVGAAIIVVFGIFATYSIGNRINTHERETLRIRAENVVRAIPASLVEALSGDESDLSKPEYQNLKSLMVDLKSINPDARFIYLMGRAIDPETSLLAGTLFFYVDSEPADSDDYSPPGQVYEDTRPEDITQYESGKSSTDGPYKDSWGEWVSAYAPIVNAEGETIAIVGIDVSADYWQDRIMEARLIVGLLTLLLFGFFLFLLLYLNRVAGQMQTLSARTTTLTRESDASNQIAILASLGKWSLNHHSNELVFDQQAVTMLGLKDNSIVRDNFEARLEEKSKERFTKAWNDVAENHHEKFNTLIEIILENGTTKDMLMIGIARFTSLGKLERFSGTIQDVSEVLKNVDI